MVSDGKVHKCAIMAPNQTNPVSKSLTRLDKARAVAVNLSKDVAHARVNLRLALVTLKHVAQRWHRVSKGLVSVRVCGSGIKRLVQAKQTHEESQHNGACPPPG
jgi:hypothetical protein